jgi:L-aspartate oxidase
MTHTPAGEAFQIQADVVIIGAGLAGLVAALTCADSGLRVALAFATAGETPSSSYWAQGGIAAFTGASATRYSDTLEQHIQDTYMAGAQTGTLSAIHTLLSQGEHAVQWLQAQGVQFDRTPEGIALTREGAHTHPRILHVHGDQTGKGLVQPLIQRVKQHANIQCFPQYRLQGLIQPAPHERVYGVHLHHMETATPCTVLARATVLATGGYSALYSHTTTPAHNLGQATALAAQAGAPLRDMHLVQFHPTAFWQGGAVRFLISEALRGEGAILRNAQGKAFAKTYHPQGELAPRDIVARAIFNETTRSPQDAVYLDASGFSDVAFQQRFPFIYQEARRYGVHPPRDPLPVSPAAHYCMGGIVASPHGETDVPGLYALGEAAHTGLHGANRLASNSLLECVTMGLLFSQHVPSQQRKSIPAQRWLPHPLSYLDSEAVPHTDVAQQQASREAYTAWLNTIRQGMWQHLGIIRTRAGMAELERELVQWEGVLSSFTP